MLSRKYAIVCGLYALNSSQEEPHFISLNIVQTRINVAHQIYFVYLYIYWLD